ncbi:unnamed protein product, partial [Nesidiocoris tenuis]
KFLNALAQKMFQRSDIGRGRYRFRTVMRPLSLEQSIYDFLSEYIHLGYTIDFGNDNIRWDGGRFCSGFRNEPLFPHNCQHDESTLLKIVVAVFLATELMYTFIYCGYGELLTQKYEVRYWMVNVPRRRATSPNHGKGGNDARGWLQKFRKVVTHAFSSGASSKKPLFPNPVYGRRLPRPGRIYFLYSNVLLILQHNRLWAECSMRFQLPGSTTALSHAP